MIARGFFSKLFRCDVAAQTHRLRELCPNPSAANGLGSKEEDCDRTA